jgi:anti-anti-sigma regulatory factor
MTSQEPLGGRDSLRAAPPEPDPARPGGVALVYLAGRDFSNADEVLAVGRELSALLDRGCRELVVSLAGAVGVGTALIGKLLMLRNQAAAVGGRLALCRLAPQLHHDLEGAGLARLFHVYATEQEAIRPRAGSVTPTGRPAQP